MIEGMWRVVWGAGGEGGRWCGVLCVGGVGGGRVGHLSDGDGHSEFLLAGHGSDGRLLVLWDSEGEEGEQEGGGG